MTQRKTLIDSYSVASSNSCVPLYRRIRGSELLKNGIPLSNFDSLSSRHQMNRLGQQRHGNLPATGEIIAARHMGEQLIVMMMS